MSKIKVIVTGGNGFIGSHIVDRLVKDNYDVHVIDNLSATSNDKFYFNDDATNHKIDICDKESMDSIFQNVSYVFHLAAESRIQPAILNPENAYSVNVLGTLNVLQLSKKHNIKRIMYSSTSAAYGTTDVLPTDENCIIDCLNPYSSSKYMGEELCRMYSKVDNMDIVIFRYFNVFGERSPVAGQYAPVVGIFLNQKEQNQPLTIVGDGEQRRDFVHVYDITEVNMLAMNYEGYSDSITLNIGSGKQYSINEIAHFISNDVEYIPQRPGESRHTLANIGKSMRVLKYNPQIDIKEWIK